MSMRSPALAGRRSVLFCRHWSIVAVLAIVVLLPVASSQRIRRARGGSRGRYGRTDGAGVVELIGMRHPFVVSVTTLGGFGIGAVVSKRFSNGERFGRSTMVGFGVGTPVRCRTPQAAGGSSIARIGALLMFAGFSGALCAAVPVTLASGESRVVTDPYRPRLDVRQSGGCPVRSTRPTRAGGAAVVVHNGNSRGLLTSEKRDYADSEGTSHYPPITTVGQLVHGWKTFTLCSPITCHRDRQRGGVLQSACSVSWSADRWSLSGVRSPRFLLAFLRRSWHDRECVRPRRSAGIP